MHERKPVHCLLLAPSHVIQSCHWRSVRSSLLNFQYLKQANFLTQVSSTQVVLNQWNSVSRDTTHVQAGLQHPHHFWGSTKGVSFTSLFSFSGPTLTWTFPLYKFLEAASEAATQKGITTSHTEPEKSAGTSFWLVLYLHGWSWAITFITVSFSSSLSHSCLSSSSQFYSSSTFFSFKVTFAFGSDYISLKIHVSGPFTWTDGKTVRQ